MPEPSDNFFGQSAGFAPIKSQSEVQSAEGLRITSEELAQLVTDMAAGRENALAKFYDATSSVTFGLVLRILGNATIAEEVLVDIYDQAWRQAAAYNRARFSPIVWLCAMARNQAIKRLRSGVSSAPEMAGPFDGIESEASKMTIAVRAALDALPADQREVVELAYYRGLDYGEIADKLNKEFETVRTALRVGMMKLRELLKPVVERI